MTAISANKELQNNEKPKFTTRATPRVAEKVEVKKTSRSKQAVETTEPTE
jgi:hypothetical protein